MNKIIDFNTAKVRTSPVYAVINIPAVQPVIPVVRKQNKMKRIADAVDALLSLGLGAMLFLVLGALLFSL